MRLTLELPDNREATLKAKAQAQGVTAEQYAAQVLNRDLEDEGSEPFWKTFTGPIQALPDEAFEHLPTDGASEHDHYLLWVSQEKFVSVVFADTFYWIALSNRTDSLLQFVKRVLISFNRKRGARNSRP